MSAHFISPLYFTCRSTIGTTENMFQRDFKAEIKDYRPITSVFHFTAQKRDSKSQAKHFDIEVTVK